MDGTTSRGSGELGVSLGLYGGDVGGNSLVRCSSTQELTVLLTASQVKVLIPME